MQGGFAFNHTRIQTVVAVCLAHGGSYLLYLFPCIRMTQGTANT